MSKKKPVWFTDWRALYRQKAWRLGCDALLLFDGRRIRMDRVLWKKLHQLKRIKSRLDIESEVRDKTWRRYIMKCILNEMRENDND